MRVALVITELDTGGAERCATELALYLAGRSHAVHVFALGPPPIAPRDELVHRLVASGVPVQFGNAVGSLHAPRAAHWLRSRLRQFAPDIVQAMLWHANVCSAVALRKTQTPLIGGMRVSEPRRWRWPIERWAAHRMKAIVCVSDDVRKHAQGRQRLPSGKLIVIPNGIARREEVSQAEIELEKMPHGDAPGMVFVGRLEPQKGVTPLMEQLPHILSAMPHWHMTFVGKGGEQPRLEQRVRAVGLMDRVHFVGWKKNADRWIAASRILLLPAIYEGMPNVLLEAMSAGKPFVAFAVDGISELLADEYPRHLADAQLVAAGDWPGFIDRVHRFGNDESLRNACGQANRAHVMSHFQLIDQLAKYEALYRTTLDGLSLKARSPA